MKKLILASALVIGTFGFGNAAFAQATCPQYEAAGKIIFTQYAGVPKGSDAPAATTVIVSELKKLNPGTADAAEIAAVESKLKTAGYPKDGVVAAIKGLEPKFRAKAEAAGCKLPPLPAT